MRIALISDIHGNAYALDFVLADVRAQAVDRIVCLGDAIQGGAQPAETVRRMRELGCPIVMGNADAWLLSGVNTGAEQITPQQEAVRQWSLAQLSPDDRAFISGFAPTVRIEVTDHDALLCFHGTPASFDEIILPSTPYAVVREHLSGHDARWLAGGHTHIQQVRRLGSGFFCNPGSVGRPYNTEWPEVEHGPDPWADYAILAATEQSVSLEFRRLPLDTAPLAQLLRASDHPDAERLIQAYGG